MNKRLLSLLVLGLALNACSDNKEQASQNPQNSVLAQQAAPTQTTIAITNTNTAANPIQTEPVSQAHSSSEYEVLDWESLELPGKGLADIMRKYQPLLDKISDEEVEAGDKLMDQMQNELNTAPTNPALNGKRIQLKGFVSPLEVDEQRGSVKEFLLVPYFGACIHVPPPPVNQTILVRPQADKSIRMEQIYEPVNVSGVISVEAAQTKLAPVGYQISEAIVEPLKPTDY